MSLIAELKGDRLFDFIADAAGPVARIATDERLREAAAGDGEVSDKTASIVKLLFREHKDDLKTVIASLKGITVEECDQIPAPVLMRDIMDVLTDESLSDFLSLAAKV